MITAWIVVGFLMAGLWLAGEFVRAPIVSDTADDRNFFPVSRRRHLGAACGNQGLPGGRQKPDPGRSHAVGIREFHIRARPSRQDRRRALHTVRVQFRGDDAARRLHRWRSYDEGPRYDM
jgi:hypothetical protein